MIYIPAIYFTILLVLILKIKERFELSALLACSYLVTSIFAIFIDLLDIYGYAGCIDADKKITPIILYCFLITLTIIPFFNLTSISRYNFVPIRNLWIFNRIIWLYSIIFVLVIYFFGYEIITRFEMSEIMSLRNEYAAEGNDLGFSKLNNLERLIARVVFILSYASIFLQGLYFYSLAFLKKNKLFNLGILLLSLTSVVLSIATFDRSKMAYWILSFVALTVFFWPILTTKRKRELRFSFLTFISISALYLSYITAARYGEHEFGAVLSVVVYLGQPLNNFCLFYEELIFQGLNFLYVFPTVGFFLDSLEIHSLVKRDYAIDVNVFASFSGMLIKEIGVLNTILYCCIYGAVSSLIFKKLPRYNLLKMFLVIAIFYVPFLGIFGLYYSSLERELSVFVGLVVCYLFIRKV
jgi:hypothetical protein